MLISNHEFTETITWRCSIEKLEPSTEHKFLYEIRYQTHEGCVTRGGYVTYKQALDHATHYSATERVMLENYGKSAKSIVKLSAYTYKNWPFTAFFAFLPHSVLATVIMRSIFIDNVPSNYLFFVGVISLTLLGALALASLYYIGSILSDISYWKSALKEALDFFWLYGVSQWWRSLNLEVKWFVILSYILTAILLIDLINGDIIIKFHYYVE